MCDRCTAIDTIIAQYQRMRDTVTDTLALTLIAEVIADLIAEKTALHPESEEE